MSDWELPESVKPQSIERASGGFAWESGVYKCTVKLVYLDQAKTEAISFNVTLVNDAGKELKEALYIKGGKAKGNKSYYTGQDGIDRPIPGYSVANSLCVAATGQSLAKCMETLEKKVVKVYDFAAGKEMPIERPVVMPLLNTKVTVAVHQITEDKTKKNETTGQYDATGETRTKNECKFFGDIEGKSAEEIVSGEPAAAMAAWAEKNTGVVIDKTAKKDANTSAAGIMGGGTPTEAAASSGSLFD